MTTTNLILGEEDKKKGKRGGRRWNENTATKIKLFYAEDIII